VVVVVVPELVILVALIFVEVSTAFAIAGALNVAAALVLVLGLADGPLR
jgi:hypothetical protein